MKYLSDNCQEIANYFKFFPIGLKTIDLIETVRANILVPLGG